MEFFEKFSRQCLISQKSITMESNNTMCIYIYIKIYLIDSESFFFFFCIFKHGDSDIYHIFIISIIHLSCTKVKLILNRKQPKLVKFKGESFHAVIIRFVTDRRKKKKKKREKLVVESMERFEPESPGKVENRQRRSVYFIAGVRFSISANVHPPTPS